MITATEIFCLNEIGKRSNNEDSISPSKGSATLSDRLFVVCDGVGGEKRGEIASEIVCTAIHNYIKKDKPYPGSEKEALQKAISRANKELAGFVANNADAKRMSTTMALVFLGEESVIAAWCGDTRIYHLHDGRIIWKSKDHSLVSELVSQGELTEEEAISHPRRNVITRSLNASNTNNEVDFYEINNFDTGDYLLLCTDGLLEKINDQAIYKILNDDNEKDKAKLFLSYCDGMTKDNFSMYLIRGKHTKKKKHLLPVFRIILIVSFLLLLVFMAVILLRNNF